MKLCFVLFMIVLTGCNCSRGRHDVPLNPADVQAELIEANKKKHQLETEHIKTFIGNKKWPMTETNSGLHYWIYKNGTGEIAAQGQRVSLAYTVSLTDGTECYRADENNPGTFVIGRDNVESGLHEMVQLMHVGDKAKVILPSHLAFGLTGDSQKIPGNATLVYDIELLAVK